MRESSTRGEEGVSEALSYVLIFGLMSIGAAIIYLQGTPAIQSMEERQINENSERAMLLMQERLDEMIQQDAPSRTVSMEAHDMSLSVGGREAGSVNITARSGGDRIEYNSTFEPVYVETETRVILYENGAVISGVSDEGWGMVSDPSWAVSTNESDYVRSALLRTVATTGDRQISATQTRVRFSFESVAEETDAESGIDELNITVSSPRDEAWEMYFNRLNRSIEGGDVDGSVDGSVSMEIDEFEGGEGLLSHREKTLRTDIETR